MPANLNESLKTSEPHQLTAKEVLQRLEVDAANGLSTSEALRRLGS
jgi:hypothetical protein